jgi:hypothetical protein
LLRRELVVVFTRIVQPCRIAVGVICREWWSSSRIGRCAIKARTLGPAGFNIGNPTHVVSRCADRKQPPRYRWREVLRCSAIARDFASLQPKPGTAPTHELFVLRVERARGRDRAAFQKSGVKKPIRPFLHMEHRCVRFKASA